MESLNYVEGWPDRSRGPVRVEIHLQVLNGRLECVGLLIGVLDGYPDEADENFYDPILSESHSLKAEVLRKLHLPKLIERAIAHKHDSLQKLAELEPSDWGEYAEMTKRVKDWAEALLPAIEQRPKPTGRRGHPPERWIEVAAVYRTAHAQRRPPTLAVANEFNVSKSTAAKYVAKARHLGLLSPTTRGRPSI